MFKIAIKDKSRAVKLAESEDIDITLSSLKNTWLQKITLESSDDVYGEVLPLYEYVPSIDLNSKPIDSISTSQLKELIPDIDVLLVTTTAVERMALYESFFPLPGQLSIVEGALEHSTYRLGRFGRYLAAHVECTMSGEGRAGSPLTVSEGIREIDPKAILIIGIAFGVDKKKQSLGDVLIAETVVPYELSRQGKKIIPRGQQLPCGPILSERFRTRRMDWELKRGDELVKVHQGVLLSGAKLIDDINFRNTLLEHFPTAIGGEMEGAGAYAAANRSSNEIILIKGICDWADGHKNDRAQAFASMAAVSIALHVLSKEDVLRSLKAKDVASIMDLNDTLKEPSESTKKHTLISEKDDKKSINEIEFIGRKEELSSLERIRNDGRMIMFLHGVHGIGKTALIKKYTSSIKKDSSEIHYINFQHTATGDTSFTDEFLPRGYPDEDLIKRIIAMISKLQNLSSDDILIFDEIEALLYYTGEWELIYFLRRLLRHTNGAQVIIIIARRNWPRLEWNIVHDSPMLHEFRSLELSSLNSDDTLLLVNHLVALKNIRLEESVLEGIAKLSGGIPLLIIKWFEHIYDFDKNQQLQLYSKLLDISEAYFRGTWNSFSESEKFSVLNQMLEQFVNYSESTDSAKFIEINDKLGSTSAAFCWWLMINPEELPNPKFRNKNILNDFQQKAEELKSVDELLNLWKW